MTLRGDGISRSGKSCSFSLPWQAGSPGSLIGIMRLLHSPLMTWGESLRCTTALGKHRHGGAMLQGRRLQPVICPGSAMSQPGVRGKYGRTIMITSAGIRRIAVRLMLAFRTLEENMSRFSLEELPSVMTVDEVSSVLGICTKTCCKLIRENLLHGVKVGRSYRIAKSELFRFLKALPNDREEHRSIQHQTDIFREG